MSKLGKIAGLALTPIVGLMLIFMYANGGMLRGPNPVLLETYRRACDNKELGFSICPRLFVLGAQKSGTTTFYSYMASHRDFRPAMPLDGSTRRVKELSYFIHKHEMSPRWAKAELVQNYLPYFSSRATTEEWASDATPTMLYHPEAPRNLINTGLRQGSRFVILLRDPVDRAISNMEKRVRGKERRAAPNAYNLTEVADKCIPLLEKCRAEARGRGRLGIGYFSCAKNLTWDNLWIDLCESLNKGFYADALRSWLMEGYDGRKEFCIMPTARFLASPSQTADQTGLNQRCLEETGVDLSGFPAWPELPEDMHYNVHNKALTQEEGEVRERLHKFYAAANAELRQLLADEFGVEDFKFEWP